MRRLWDAVATMLHNVVYVHVVRDTEAGRLSACKLRGRRDRHQAWRIWFQSWDGEGEYANVRFPLTKDELEVDAIISAATVEDAIACIATLRGEIEVAGGEISDDDAV